MRTLVASIYFHPVTAHRHYRGSTYALPAVPLNGEPAILTCDDLMQYDDGPYNSGPGGQQREKKQWPVYGEEIARDVVGEWTTTGLGMNPDCHPGIWVVRDRLPVMKIEKNGEVVPETDFQGKQVFRPATPDEKATMWAEDLLENRRADRAYAEACWLKAEALAADPKTRQFISNVYKSAARQYGMPGQWVKEAAALESRQCGACGTVNPAENFVCQKCTQPIDLARWAQWTTEKDAALRDAKKAGPSQVLQPPTGASGPATVLQPPMAESRVSA